MPQAYLELKIAWEMFQKAPAALTGSESARLTEIAARQSRIEQKILASAEAAQVCVPAATLATRIAEIRARYPAQDEFAQDIARLGLSAEGLQACVERDLRVEALLEKVAANAPPVSAVEAEIYYHLHPEAFTPPESRQLRHILITFNDTDEKARAIALLESLRPGLEDASKFGAAALRHSQCPSALHGGQLGKVKRRQLFPALEEAAFSLEEGEVSAILTSPIGLHLLRCDRIQPADTLGFAGVEAKIIERLTDQRRATAQKSWIKALF